MSKDRSEILVVVGPTASGKTALAVRLAEVLGGEIVTADSVQVYRRFDIGAGKPTSDERARARHHLIDVVEPLEPMDASRFAELADRAIVEIRGRGRVPIVCGGTFLWVRALLYGLAEAPPGDLAIRDAHRAVAETEGRDALHRRLAAVDPVAAERLAPNDFVRVSRALEVYEQSGVPLTTWHERHGFRERRHVARLVGIERTGPELDGRIAARTQAMLDAGWVDEVRALLADGFGDARPMKAVGYRQIAEALARGVFERDELAAEIVRKTRVFARRQRTWLKDEPVLWLAEPERRSDVELERSVQ